MTAYAIIWLEKTKRLIIKYDITAAFLCAITLIVIGVLLGIQNSRFVLPSPSTHDQYYSPFSLGFLSNWDGTYYLAIAKHGYTTLLSAGFYPLYPLLIRVFFYIFRSYLASALFVSWTSLVVAIYFYIKIARELGLVNKDLARVLSVLPFILFPTGVFLLATYTESLFAALALGSIYFSLRRRYIFAGVLLLLATLTHITGIFLIILDILLLWEQRVSFRKIAIVAALGICGAAAFEIYLSVRYHNPFAFLESQTEVHNWLEPSYYHLLLSTSLLNILFSMLLIASAAFYWDKRKSFAVYALLFLLIPLVGKQWGGFDRYVLMAFPIPLMINEYFRDKHQAYVVVIVITTILWTFTLLQYAAGYIGS